MRVAGALCCVGRRRELGAASGDRKKKWVMPWGMGVGRSGAVGLAWAGQRPRRGRKTRKAAKQQGARLGSWKAVGVRPFCGPGGACQYRGSMGCRAKGRAGQGRIG